MGNMLSSATSGLLAFQRALDTTSHNIANVNTPGFSRQRVQLGTREPQAYANGWLGNGADVLTVERIVDRFVAEQTRNSSSSLQRLGVYSNSADELSNIFGDAQTGLSASLQKFINAFQEVANSPTSIPARQVVLSQAQSLVDRLTNYNDRLTAIDKRINANLVEETSAINAIAKNIAELNQRITVEGARTGQPPNDLLDQRDKLVDDLATHVNVSVATQDNGAFIVSIGTGQSLVVGAEAARLVAVADPYDATRNVIGFQGSGGAPVDVTSRLAGGTLGGALDFRRDLLDPARNSVGRISIGLAEVVNAQHRAGIDLNGNFGQDLLSVGGVDALARTANVGSGSLNVTRTATCGLTEYDYILQSTGAGWTLRRADTGAAVTFAGLGTPASPIVADGLSIVASGAPVSGDSFLIRPTRAAIAGFGLLVSDPNSVAAAAPIATAVNANNNGNGAISAGEVLDVTNAQLLTPVTLRFLTATTYSVNGAGSFAYTPGANIDINGWRVTISGAPAINDTFTVGPNNNPAGDNRNALKLAGALATPVLDNSTVSLNAGAGKLIGQIGVTSNQARINLEAQQSIYDYNVSARDSVSGVNLDEEAATLMRYQQAYQAAAQVIRMADTLFQSILDATRR